MCIICHQDQKVTTLQNTGTIGRFARFLTYKAKGKKVIEISEANTTKECCIGGKKEDRPLYGRNINCDCGNRDKNSAVNNGSFPIARTLCGRAISLHERFAATNRFGIRLQANVQTLAGSHFPNL